MVIRPIPLHLTRPFTTTSISPHRPTCFKLLRNEEEFKRKPYNQELTLTLGLVNHRQMDIRVGTFTLTPLNTIFTIIYVPLILVSV